MASPRDPRSNSGSALAKRAAKQPSFFARARVWLRPPRRLRPTRAGWTFFLFTFGVGFASLNTGNNLLYLVLSLMLAFLVLSGILSEMALRGIQVRRRLPSEIFAEQDARVTLEISNEEQRGVAFAIVVEDRIGRPGEADRAAGRTFVLRLPPKKCETRSYTLNVQSRGPMEFRGFVVSTRFPFGLFAKSLLLDAHDTTLVYPATKPIAVSSIKALGIREGESSPRVSPEGSGAVVTGVRDYAHGDDRRRIDWRTTLRTGDLFVRELENELDAEVEVTLNESSTLANELEDRIRRAASEIVSYLDAGRRVGLRANHDCFEANEGAHHRAQMLAYLARVPHKIEEARS